MVTLRTLAFALAILLLVLGAARPAEGAWPANGAPLVIDPSSQDDPVVLPDGAGGAVVVWQEYRFGSTDIYAQRVDSNGVVQWAGNGRSVVTEPNPQGGFAAGYFPGGAVVVWADQRNGRTDLYGQRLDAQGLPQWTTNGRLLAGTNDTERDPVIEYDGASGLIDPGGYNLVWIESTSFPSSTRLAAKHIDMAGATTWSTGLASTLLDRSGVVMASDGLGIATGPRGLVAAWEQGGETADFDIYARRVTVAGAVQWTADGVAVCDVAGAQQSPAIVQVGGGFTIIAWEDSRNAASGIFAQKLSSTGAAIWTADGLPICQGVGTRGRVKIAWDGAGGAYLVWNDSRSGTTEVYAQRIDGNGQPLWDPAGVLVCSAAGSHRDPQLAGLGASGLVVAWSDDRAGVAAHHFYAQRMDANGTRLWGAGGVPLCAASGNRNRLNLVASGTLAVIAGWTDYRAGNSDVYANRLTASGGVLDASPLEPGRLRLGLLSSNPGAGEVRLRLELAAPATVDAVVLDPLGRRVRALRSGPFEPGEHVIRWDGADDAGAPAAAGIYFVRVRAGAETRFAKLVRVR